MFWRRRETLNIFKNIPEKNKNFNAIWAVLGHSKSKIFSVGQPWWLTFFPDLGSPNYFSAATALEDNFFFSQDSILTNTFVWPSLTILTGKHCAVFYSIQYKNDCLAASGLFHVFTQSVSLYIPLSHIKEHRCLKNVIHQIDSKNEWLFFSTRFTGKLYLIFVLRWLAWLI